MALRNTTRRDARVNGTRVNEQKPSCLSPVEEADWEEAKLGREVHDRARHDGETPCHETDEVDVEPDAADLRVGKPGSVQIQDYSLD